MKRLGFALLATVAMALARPEAASAANYSEGSDTSAIEEIVVTARRRAESAQSVPIPITAMTGEQLASRGIEDISDISRVTPNLQYRTNGFFKDTAVVFLRGIGQVNTAPSNDPKVGIYLDGVYLARPQGAVFDLVDIDRVEVIRGPQGTLFGRNTTAGLVHVVTNQPKPEVYEGMLEAGMGNDGQYVVAGVLNVPFSDTLTGRFSLQRREADGTIENTSTGEDWNNDETLIFRGSLLAEPTESIDVSFGLDYQRTRGRSALGSCEWTAPESGAVALTQPGLPAVAYLFGVYDEIKDTCRDTSPTRSHDNDPGKSEVDALGASLTLNWNLGPAELTSISAYRKSEVLQQSFGFGSDAIGTASYVEILQFEASDFDQWSQEFRLSGTAFDDRVHWLAGVYGFKEDGTQPASFRYFRDVPIPTPAQSPAFYIPTPSGGRLGDIALYIQNVVSKDTYSRAKNGSWAAFTEFTYEVTPRLSVTGGLRFTQDTRKFIRSQFLPGDAPDPTYVCYDGSLPADGATCTRSKDFSGTTPRLIVDYDVSESVMLYGSWSRGYSSGGFNGNASMRPYEPERADNWELGLKSSWLDQRLQVNLTSFYNDYDNQQISVARLVGGALTVEALNAQKAKLYGLEGELTASLTGHWQVFASFGILGGDYEKFVVTDTVVGPPPDFAVSELERDLSDQELVNGPANTYSISSAYTFDLDGGNDVTAQLGWSYRGRAYYTVETLPTSRQSGYGLLDGRLTWSFRGGRSSLALWGTNLLDKTYFSAAGDLSGGDAPVGTVTKYWGPPRRFSLEYTHHFGG